MSDLLRQMKAEPGDILIEKSCDTCVMNAGVVCMGSGKRKDNGDVEAIKLSINAMKTLNDKTDDEIYALFSTGAFIDILKGYCKKALINCKFDKKQIDTVMDELKWLLDTLSAKEVL